jgi:hypothetical protein
MYVGEVERRRATVAQQQSDAKINENKKDPW